MERMAPFTLHRPATLAEAVERLAADPAARPVAGGTDLVPNLRDGLGAPAVLVDVAAIPGLDAIDVDADGAVALGANVTLARIARDAAIAERLPALAEAAASVAGPAHRTVATLGGNLCLDTRCIFYNQSAWWRKANDYCLKHGGETCHVAPQGTRCHAAYAGDTAPVLIALAAEVDVASAAGTRRVALERLYADDGAKHLALAPGELVTRVHVPAQPRVARSAYRKARARGAIDFPLAGVAVRLAATDGVVDDLRIAVTGTNSHPLLLAGTEAFVGRRVDDAMLAAIAKLVQKQVKPMRTSVTSSNWRRVAASVIARRLVAQLAGVPAASTA